MYNLIQHVYDKPEQILQTIFVPGARDVVLAKNPETLPEAQNETVDTSSECSSI